MTAESGMTGRMTLSPGTKTSKPLASFMSASALLRRHVPVHSSLKSTRATLAKSPSTSSSDSSSGKRGLHGGKGAISSRIKALIPQGKSKDAPGEARPSSSESPAQMSPTGTEFEASNELQLECVKPDETKRIIDVAEPPLLKDLDVVHSNLAVTWFNVDDDEFDDFLKTKADQNPHMTASEEQNSLSAAADDTVTPGSILESINNGYVDEFDGAIGRVYDTNTTLQDKLTIEEGKAVVEELSLKMTPDVTDCSEGKDNFHKCGDGPASPETSDGVNVVKLAFENLMRQGDQGNNAFRGWRAMKLLLPSLLVLFTVLFCVNNMIESELSLVPPPT